MAEFINFRVKFKSVEPYFSAERDGRKPNTLRHVTEEEFGRLGTCNTITVVGPDGDSFDRTITSIFDVECVVAPIDLPGRLIQISWEHVDTDYKRPPEAIAVDADCAACINSMFDFSETCNGKPCPHWREHALEARR